MAQAKAEDNIWGVVSKKKTTEDYIPQTLFKIDEIPNGMELIMCLLSQTDNNSTYFTLPLSSNPKIISDYLEFEGSKILSKGFCDRPLTKRNPYYCVIKRKLPIKIWKQTEHVKEWNNELYLYLGKVLSNVLRSSYHFFLSDPVFQIINFSLQLIKFKSLVQFPSAFLC